jgi:very-short-patch-repair endonuclease
MDATELDQLMRQWAVRQHGLVSRDQFVEHGIDPRAARRRVASRHWDEVTQRVLRLVGSAPTDQQRVMAAVLDAGRGAVASHRTAAAVWGLGGRGRRPLEVSRPRDGSARPTTLALVYRPRFLPEHHVTSHDGIPVTTLARTVVDMAATEHPGRVEVTAHAAVRAGMAWELLAATAEEIGGRGVRGIGVVRRLVEGNIGRPALESGLEVRFLSILRAAGLPEPRRQVNLGGEAWAGRVDFVDDAARLVLEINSARYHDGPLERRRDDRRTAALVAAGYRVLPLSEDLIVNTPDEMLRLVVQARRTAS